MYTDKKSSTRRFVVQLTLYPYFYSFETRILVISHTFRKLYYDLVFGVHNENNRFPRIIGRREKNCYKKHINRFRRPRHDWFVYASAKFCAKASTAKRAKAKKKRRSTRRARRGGNTRVRKCAHGSSLLKRTPFARGSSWSLWNVSERTMEIPRRLLCATKN